MPYEHQHYPKWKYHPSGDSVIVASAEIETALSGEWFDCPSEASAAKVVKIPKPSRFNKSKDAQ